MEGLLSTGPTPSSFWTERQSDLDCIIPTRLGVRAFQSYSYDSLNQRRMALQGWRKMTHFFGMALFVGL